MKDALTTLLIVFLSLRLMDFGNLTILDYLILAGIVSLIAVSILDYFHKGKRP